MKKNILLIQFLLICLIGNAQIFTSNSMSIWNFSNELLVVSDDLGNQVLRIEDSFTKHDAIKKTIKNFNINGQSYFITREKKGLQSVYTDKWELVAQMTKRGREITFQDTNTTYRKQEKNKFFNPGIINYLDKNDHTVASMTLVKKRRLEYKNQTDEKTDLLLMALGIHQYQEKMKRDENYGILQLIPVFIFDLM